MPLFFLTHGHLYHPENLPPLAAGDVLVYGHTHLPQAVYNDAGIALFNPGSVALPKGGHPASYGMYQDGVVTIHRVDDGTEIARLAITS